MFFGLNKGILEGYTCMSWDIEPQNIICVYTQIHISYDFIIIMCIYIYIYIYNYIYNILYIYIKWDVELRTQQKIRWNIRYPKNGNVTDVTSKTGNLTSIHSEVRSCFRLLPPSVQKTHMKMRVIMTRSYTKSLATCHAFPDFPGPKRSMLQQGTEEQAVSTMQDGPFNPRAQEIRPAETEKDIPTNPISTSQEDQNGGIYVSINGDTQNGWFIRENPSKLDDLVVPIFQEQKGTPWECRL